MNQSPKERTIQNEKPQQYKHTCKHKHNSVSPYRKITLLYVAVLI